MKEYWLQLWAMAPRKDSELIDEEDWYIGGYFTGLNTDSNSEPGNGLANRPKATAAWKQGYADAKGDLKLRDTS